MSDRVYTHRNQSRGDWGNNESIPKDEVLNCGSLMRIADALEKIAGLMEGNDPEFRKRKSELDIYRARRRAKNSAVNRTKRMFSCVTKKNSKFQEAVSRASLRAFPDEMTSEEILYFDPEKFDWSKVIPEMKGVGQKRFREVLQKYAEYKSTLQSPSCPSLIPK